MTPSALIQTATADGVRFAVSATGGIRMHGDDAAVKRWLPALRAHKSAILAELTKASPTPSPLRGYDGTLTARDEAALRAWLAHIEEADPEIIGEVLRRCSADPDTLRYFLARAKEVQP